MNTLKKRNAVIAAVAGAALLLGGSTYALWSAQASLGSTTIQAGDLNLQVLDGDNGPGVQLWDISPDHRPFGIPLMVAGVAIKQDGNQVIGNSIDSTFRAVPRDEILLTVPFSMTLDGSNLVARLDAKYNAPVSESAALQSVLETTWNVVAYNGTSIGAVQAADGNGEQAYFVTDKQFSGLNLGNIAVNTVEPRTPTTFVLVADITFGEDDPGAAMDQVLALSDSINLSLNQIRSSADLAQIPLATATP
ncbi:MAG: SipW-dependent-type signal peptide-containing protein [Propionibacteriaceae bacterium]|nr:SipW-dependent-type signal peptide-containing protein [Propionibacteriaceae bacterium]